MRDPLYWLDAHYRHLPTFNFPPTPLIQISHQDCLEIVVAATCNIRNHCLIKIVISWSWSKMASSTWAILVFLYSFWERTSTIHPIYYSRWVHFMMLVYLFPIDKGLWNSISHYKKKKKSAFRCMIVPLRFIYISSLQAWYRLPRVSHPTSHIIHQLKIVLCLERSTSKLGISLMEPDNTTYKLERVLAMMLVEFLRII